MKGEIDWSVIIGWCDRVRGEDTVSVYMSADHPTWGGERGNVCWDIWVVFVQRASGHLSEWDAAAASDRPGPKWPIDLFPWCSAPALSLWSGMKNRSHVPNKTFLLGQHVLRWSTVPSLFFRALCMKSAAGLKYWLRSKLSESSAGMPR